MTRYVRRELSNNKKLATGFRNNLQLLYKITNHISFIIMLTRLSTLETQSIKVQ